MGKWVVLAETDGDDTTGSYGRRLWSHAFETHDAARDAKRFLDQVANCRCIIIHDLPQADQVQAA